MHVEEAHVWELFTIDKFMHVTVLNRLMKGGLQRRMSDIGQNVEVRPPKAIAMERDQTPSPNPGDELIITGETNNNDGGGGDGDSKSCCC